MTTRLGIDIGGTGIKGAPVDVDTGELVADRTRIPTPQPATPEAVAGVVEALVSAFDWTGSIGATFPAVVERGIVHTANNVDEAWVGTDAASLFAAATGQSVTVLNDADAAGVAEMAFGAGKGRGGTVILVTLGTGIGSAIFVDGTLLPNSEFGGLQVRGKAAEHRAAESVRERKDLSWKEWGARLDEFLAQLEDLLRPELIIVGGGVSKKADKFLPLLHTRAEIVPATLRNEAGIVGAALAAG